jgi:uncharacterized protein
MNARALFMRIGVLLVIVAATAVAGNLADKLLLEAAESGDLTTVLNALENGADIEARYSSGGFSVLGVAAANGHTDIVLELLERKADPNSANGDEGYTLAGLAASHGHKRIVESLLDHGARIEGLPSGYSPLERAISGAHQETALLLLRRGANWKVRDSHDDPMLIASIWAGADRVVKALIAKGASPISTRGTRDMTPLCAATSLEDPSVAQILLNAGASPNERRGAPLRSAAARGNLKVLKLLYDWGAEINAHDENGETALCAAVAANQLDSVNWLIAHDALDSRGEGGKALRTASLHSHPPIVNALLKAGVDANARGEEGESAIFTATAQEILDALLAAGADVNAKDHAGRTPIYQTLSVRIEPKPMNEAATSRTKGKLTWLLAHGADVNVLDKEGMTPMMTALAWHNSEAVTALKAAGARDQMDLYSAVVAGDAAKVREALDGGSDPNQQWTHERTPLVIASRDGNVEVIRELLAHGADVHARPNKGQQFAQFIGPVGSAASAGRIEAMKALIDVGAEIDETDSSRRTPLMHAIWLGKNEAAKWLIEQGARVTADDGATDDPLGWAAQRRVSPKVIKMLIARGADVNRNRINEGTPLMRAVTASRLEAVVALLEAGADPKARDADGGTAIMRTRAIDVAKALIAHGADILAKDNHGLNARAHAVKIGYKDVAS